MSQSSISRFLNTATVASAATINQIKIITKFKPISTNPAPTSTSFANSTNCTLGKYVVKPNIGYFSIRISNNEPKIGRASCRERVEIEEKDVGVRNKM